MSVKEDDISDDQDESARFARFIERYEEPIKQFGMLRKYPSSERFLLDNPDLVCEFTANFLVVYCIELEMGDKHDLMVHVARQTIILQFILELAKGIGKDPRACIKPFFTRIQNGEAEAMAGLENELEAFVLRIEKRAKEKIEEIYAEQEKEEKQKRLGPGGLDPLEVLESLPTPLKTCFENQDIEMLKSTLSQMPQDEAKYHIDRCVKSGLWVPEKSEKSQ
ncbi:hypothetical protein ACOME3_004498 [Neoechinorhynchus agilis]